MRSPPPLCHPDHGLIGRGAMGEVRLLWDELLERPLAGKVAHDEALEARLTHEARITAQINHPGVVPVHEIGRLSDGRLCFTMEPVDGRTLGQHIAAAHGLGLPARELRQLVEALRRVAQTVGYAHEHGVVHLDLKPDNVMLGRFGEVRVLDWGLAMPVGAPRDPGAGSPAWMPPEQARRGAAHPTQDVYALGGLLYQILAGAVPQPLGPIVPPRALAAACARPPPDELAAICGRALAPDPEHRYPDGAAFAEDLGAWLDGVYREDRARTLLQRGQALAPHIAALRARSSALRDQAAHGLGALPRSAPVSEKRAWWALEDEAAALEREAALADVERSQLLLAAMTEAPELDEVHQGLADTYHEEAERAEQRRDDDALARLEALIRVHDRGRHAPWLRREGALDLRTDPPGVEVWAQRLTLMERRLTPGPALYLGRTPLEGVSLPAGGHLLTLRGEGLAEVHYPVLIPRAGSWSPQRPGEPEPHVLRLPQASDLGPDDVFVPAGPAWLGDPDMQAGLPRRRVWVDSFAIRRHPVTNREYLAWLNALVAEGRADEAARHGPAVCPTAGGATNTPIYGRDRDGRFILAPDPEGDLWDPEWPVVLVDWRSAVAFAQWTSQNTGKPWRLLWEPEREKALRGVDGRSLPWGDHVEASWTRNAQTAPGKPTPAPVGHPIEDRSVYGVLGLAGNVRDWTLSLRSPVWEHLTQEGLFTPPPAFSGTGWDGWRLNLGGAWSSGPGFGRAGYRLGAPPEHRNALIGFRLARSLL